MPDRLRMNTQHVPKYQVVKEFLERQLASGAYRPGTQIPTEDALLNTLGVSKGPIRQAVSELVRAGYLRKIQGKGTFVCARADAGDDEQARDDSVCLLMPFFEKLGHVYLEELLRGVEAAALELGLRVSVLFMPVHNGVAVSSERLDTVLRQIARSRGVISITALSLAELQAVLATKVPLVSIHTAYDAFGVSVRHIPRPYERYCEMAAHYLLRHGHRRLLYLDYPRPVYPGQSSFISQATKEGAVVKTVIQENPFRLLEEMRRLIAEPRDERWTALFAARWELTNTLTDIIQAGQLRVPEDIGCLGYSEVDNGGPLTLLVPPLLETGKAGVRLLFDLPCNAQDLEPRLIERGSCPDLAQLPT